MLSSNCVFVKIFNSVDFFNHDKVGISSFTNAFILQPKT